MLCVIELRFAAGIDTNVAQCSTIKRNTKFKSAGPTAHTFAGHLDIADGDICR